MPAIIETELYKYNDIRLITLFHITNHSPGSNIVKQRDRKLQWTVKTWM